MTHTRRFVFASALLLALAPAAGRAVCPIDGAKPYTAGPVSEINGFASWVQDSEGVALEICTNPDLCFFDPVIPGVPFSEQIGFGAEGFWWLTDGTIDTTATDPSNGDTFSALIVMAAEAAFLTEVPADGDQFPFTRLRIRIDVPSAGVYTVTHPYGQEKFIVEGTGDGREINETIDVAFRPSAVNKGRVGPFLKWDATAPAPPEGYIGDGATPHTVTGSPCGTNYFQVKAVRLDGQTPLAIDPQNTDGDGDASTATTNLFIVNGKRYAGNLPTPLVADAVTYSRAADGKLNVFASAPTTATVTVEGEGLAATPLALAGDGSGRFFASLPLAPDAAPPPVVVLSAVNNPPVPNNDPASQIALVKDVVTITAAEATCSDATGACSLRIEARSSDSAAILTAGSFGVLTDGVVNPAPSVAVVPATVTVTSDVGGSDSEPVRVIHVP